MKWPVSVSVHAKDFSEARMAEFEASEIRYMELTASSAERSAPFWIGFRISKRLRKNIG